MSKTTVVWLLIYCAGLLASFVNPFFGALTYVFEYYLRPSLHWWGLPLPDLRWNFMIATVLTVTFVWRRNGLREIVKANHGPGTMLLALAGLMIVTSPFAVDSQRSWDLTGNYLKLILFHGLIVGTTRTIGAFDAFVAVHMLGAGWWGWEVYLDPKREQSRLYNIGSGDTIGDNKAAVHLLSVIPLILTYALAQRDKISRGIAVLVAPFVINAFILCNSRGGTLGLITSGALTLLAVRRGHRIRAIGAAAVLAGAFLALADPEFIARQQTTTRYEQDGSAQDRLPSWRGGLALLQDYPLGAGGGGYDRLSPTYIPAVVMLYDGAERAPHNTFVLVATEWGIPGFLLYLAYYASCLRLLRQVRRTNPQGGMWYYRSVGLQMALLGLMVGGIFTDRLYSEAPFWMGGLAVALHRLNADRLAKEAANGEPARPSSGVSREPLHPAAARVVTAQAGGV